MVEFELLWGLGLFCQELSFTRQQTQRSAEEAGFALYSRRQALLSYASRFPVGLATFILQRHKLSLAMDLSPCTAPDRRDNPKV